VWCLGWSWFVWCLVFFGVSVGVWSSALLGFWCCLGWALLFALVFRLVFGMVILLAFVAFLRFVSCLVWCSVL
jgi:hypothetical protein